ncbi:MAG: RDD family protein [Methanomicrobiales archaeon]|nr:RDD family protein [Methanomicrobiales archaeon]
MKTTLWDFGKNRKNIETILEAALKRMKGTSTEPSAGGGISDMSPKRNEATEELKPLEQLLAQGKISPQEFENAKAKILAGYGNLSCPACGASNPESAQACFNCGGALTFADGSGPAGHPGGVSPSLPGGAEQFMGQGEATGVQAPPEKVYTGFWARLGAAIIDGMLVGIFILLLGAFVSFVFAIPSSSTSSSADAASISFTFTLIIGTAISWVYYAGQESSPAQATLGKRVIGARVTDLEGKRISFGRASGRWLGKILSAASLCLGFLMIGFSKRKQGLHDKLAGTLVTYREKTV